MKEVSQVYGIQPGLIKKYWGEFDDLLVGRPVQPSEAQVKWAHVTQIVQQAVKNLNHQVKTVKSITQEALKISW